MSSFKKFDMTRSSTLSPEQVSKFDSDGVILLRNAVSAHWIDLLVRGLDRNIATPTARHRIWNRDAQGRTCFYDSQAWQTIPEYRKFVEDSPIAKTAADVLGTSQVNFFFDAVFVRTPGMQFRTPFHQDEPYWSVKGFDTCSIWMPLVGVEKKSALEFVRGSHRWPQQFRQVDFGDGRDDAIGENYEPFPDIEGNRDRYDIVSWNMEPGDCAIFNARTIHGGSGNLAGDRDLKVFNTQWLGDDVRVCFRPEGMDPDHSGMMQDLGLKPGQRIGTDTYPRFEF
jgi:ectoine hydroxylase-related dioxygenase (phytanoyl-CoA dioxygenase family)